MSRHPETAATQLESVLAPSTLPTWGLGRWAENLGHQLDHLTKWWSGRSFQLWDSWSYLNPAEQLTPQQQHLRLTVDLLSFLHEYVGLLGKKIYPYTIYGMVDGYDVPVSQICQNHEQHLAEMGQPLPRAQLETWVAQTNELYLQTPALRHQALLTLSPTGDKSEHYPGKSKHNYSFVNVLVPHGDGYILVQYTSYDRDPELAQLHQDAQTQLGGQIFAPLPLPTEPQNPAHNLIAQPVILPIESLPDLEIRVFENSHKWPTKPADLPQLDEHQFATEIDQVLAFCLTTFDQLQANFPPELAAQHFDELITITRRHFLKWVEENASNYQEKLAKNPKYQRVFDQTNVATTIKADFEFYLSALQSGQTNTPEPHQLPLGQLMSLSRQLPLGRLASAAHCIVGTPGSLVAQTNRLTSLVQRPELMSVGKFGISRMDQVAVAQELLKRPRVDITQYRPLTLTDPATGHHQTWYIPLEHWDAYAEDSYLHGEQAIGPCGVPLLEDTLVLSEAEYQDQVWLTNYLNQLNLGELSDSQQAELPDLFFKFKKLVLDTICKTTVGFDDLVVSSVVKPDHELPPALRHLAHRLDQSLNPFHELDVICRELAATDSPSATQDLPRIIAAYGGHDQQSVRSRSTESLAQAA